MDSTEHSGSYFHFCNFVNLSPVSCLFCESSNLITGYFLVSISGALYFILFLLNASLVLRDCYYLVVITWFTIYAFFQCLSLLFDLFEDWSRLWIISFFAIQRVKNWFCGEIFAVYSCWNLKESLKSWKSSYLF